MIHIQNGHIVFARFILYLYLCPWKLSSEVSFGFVLASRRPEGWKRLIKGFIPYHLLFILVWMWLHSSGLANLSFHQLQHSFQVLAAFPVLAIVSLLSPFRPNGVSYFPLLLAQGCFTILCWFPLILSISLQMVLLFF